MIRPITVLTFVLACGSGMYLYQAKHRVHLLDQQIDQTVRQTETVREQSRALHAEWMLLNDPDRLHRLAAEYLPNLQPVVPAQFTDLADLNSRLPPVAPPPPAAAATVVASAATPAPDLPVGEAATEDPAAKGASSRSRDGDTNRLNADVLPSPPTAPAAARSGNVASTPVTAQLPPAEHAPRPVAARAPQVDRPLRPVIAQAPPADHAPRPALAQAPHAPVRVANPPPLRPHPVVASVRTPQHEPVWRPTARHPMIAEAAPPRFIRSEQRPMPVMRPQTAPQSAYGGSMLGMARGTSNLPRPVPLNSDYSNSGG